MNTKKLSRTAGIFLALFVCVLSVSTLSAQLVHPLFYQAEQKTTGPGINPNAILLLDFERGEADVSYWTATNTQQNRGELAWIELADREKGDPVRFGRYAVKLNWDFTASVPAQTLGAYFNPSGGTTANPRFQVPAGTGPRVMGFWLYASPECQTAQLWFRPNIQAQNGGVVAATTGNMITVPTAGSGHGMAESNPVNWTGWRYVYYDWNSASNGGLATQALGPPPAATPTFAMFRIMQLSTATNQRPLIRGYFIVDNIRFTNGGEDYTPPTISAVTGNGTNLLPNTAVFTQAGNIALRFDYTDAGGSGINPQSAIFAVNGVIYTHGNAGFSANATSATFTRSFRNGTHTVQAYIEDNFGHITARTVTFTVNDPSVEPTNIYLELDEDAFVGRDFKMRVVTDKADDVKELDLNFQWDMLASVAPTGAVEFAPGVTGSYTYADGRLNVKIQNDIAAASGLKTLATINVTIDSRIFEDQAFRCNPGLATVTYSDDETEAFTLFSMFTREIKQDLRITIVGLIAGNPGQILVTDLATGSPLAGATVRIGSNAGVTGADGIASAAIPAGTFDIVAEKDGKFSFTTTTRALTPMLTPAPSGIRSGTNVDNTTSKTITWMSAPSALPAKIRIAKESDGEGAFVEHTGTTKDLNYAASSNVAKGSRVTLTGLEPGTTYIYQVGDGTNWSPTRSFTTTTVTDRFSFAGFGDHQLTNADQLGMFLAAGNTMAAMNPKPFFRFNVADNPDTDDRFDMQSQYSSLMDQRPGFANINLVASYGNHEYMGYAGNIKFMNGHPTVGQSPNYNHLQVGSGSHYSIYGNNTIIFAFDWEGNGIVRQTEIARWIDHILTYRYPDMTWKFVALHYPIWPGASSSGSRAALDWVFEKHNVNIVFCGHGHTFRRALVRGGNVLQNLGPTANYTDIHSYREDHKGVIHWELGGVRPSDGNSQKWTLGEVDGRKITFTVRDGQNNVTNQSFVLYHQDYELLTINFGTTCDEGDEKGTIVAHLLSGDEVEDGDTEQKGRTITFTATPDEGFKVAAWIVDGEVASGISTRSTAVSNTFTIQNYVGQVVQVEFVEDTWVGIDDIITPNLQLFPNPFTNTVNITGAENGTLKIMDITGAIVHIQEITGANETIRLEQLSAGIYFFRVEKDGEVETIKVVKK